MLNKQDAERQIRFLLHVDEGGATRVWQESLTKGDTSNLDAVWDCHNGCHSPQDDMH